MLAIPTLQTPPSDFLDSFSTGSTLAIRLHSKPHRLVVQHMLVVLLSCRSLQPTRKKSAPPGPTTLCAPRPAHRRRSGEPCGTSPLGAEKRRPMPAPSGHAQLR